MQWRGDAGPRPGAPASAPLASPGLHWGGMAPQLGCVAGWRGCGWGCGAGGAITHRAEPNQGTCEVEAVAWNPSSWTSLHALAGVAYLARVDTGVVLDDAQDAVFQVATPRVWGIGLAHDLGVSGGVEGEAIAVIGPRAQH